MNLLVYYPLCDLKKDFKGSFFALEGRIVSYEQVDPWSKPLSGAEYNDYCVIKVIVYLEDHITDGDGLTVLPGSHLHRDPT